MMKRRRKRRVRRMTDKEEDKIRTRRMKQGRKK